jgi:hypothetical protein
MMNIPSFKLTFQASEISVLDNSIIINKILAELESKKYRVRSVSDSSIIFDWNPWRLMWSFQTPYLLDGGHLEISKSENGSLVVLTYFIETLYSFLTIATVSTILIVQGEYGGLAFLGTFFLIISTYQYFTTKNVGKNLLKVILDDEFLE